MKVYFVNGYIWEDDGVSYPIIHNRNTFDSYEKATQEIKNIYSDAVAEAVEMEYDIESKWIEEYQTLEITYKQTGTVENWVIYEREVY